MNFARRIGLTNEGPEGRSAVKTVIIGAPRATADIVELGNHIRLLPEARSADPVVCDVGELTDVDCGTVDALARLQLTAQRLGRGVCLRRISPELHDLLLLAGLSDRARHAGRCRGRCAGAARPAGRGIARGCACCLHRRHAGHLGHRRRHGRWSGGHGRAHAPFARRPTVGSGGRGPSARGGLGERGAHRAHPAGGSDRLIGPRGSGVAPSAPIYEVGAQWRRGEAQKVRFRATFGRPRQLLRT
ncbi:MAG: STAS domain-containing protein [Chloroflexi bacterium]|nr:STAS domain-containing protein [Chloroflexota bacterium]MBA3740207.1 STAS domain-containing protein [Chloroflexota bacterium]